MVYARMARDHNVGAVVRAIERPLQSASWSIDEPQPDPTATERRATEWCRGVLFDALPWDLLVEWITSAVRYGHAVFEQEWAVVDGRQQPVEVDLRPATTLRNAERDGAGRLVSLTQHEGEPMPAARLLIVTLRTSGLHDWTGQPLIREAYGAWRLKVEHERKALVASNRWGAGIPFIGLPRNADRTSQEWREADEALAQVESGARSRIVKRTGQELGILDRSGQLPDLAVMIRLYGDEIAGSVLGQHLRLGTTRTGSRALGQTFSSAFLQSLVSVGRQLAAPVRRGLLVPMIRQNFGTRVRVPGLSVRNIHAAGLAEIGYLLQSGAIQPGAALDSWVRDLVDIPPEVVTTGATGTAPGSDPAGGGNTGRGANG